MRRAAARASSAKPAAAPRSSRARAAASSLIDLGVPAFTQRAAECGNTSLKSALWHLGRRVSAAELGRRAGLTEDGTDHAGLIAAARRSGAAVFARSGGSLAASLGELRWFLARRHPVLVGWWAHAEDEPHFDPAWSLAQRRARDAGHYSVVDAIDATRVGLMDPDPELRGGTWRGGRRWMSHAEFGRVWYDTDTSRYRLVERWYLVVHRGDERFAPQLGAGADFAADPPLPR